VRDERATRQLAGADRVPARGSIYLPIHPRTPATALLPPRRLGVSSLRDINAMSSLQGYIDRTPPLLSTPQPNSLFTKQAACSSFSRTDAP